MNSRRDIQPSDSGIEPSNSCTSSINNAQPVATSTPSGRHRRRLSNSGTSKSLDVKPEAKRVIFQEEPQAGSSNTPNAGRRIPRTYAQIRGRGPIRPPKSPAKAEKTPKKPATPKKTKTPKKTAYSPRVAKHQSKDIMDECEMKDAPISNQPGQNRRASPFSSPRRKALKRLNGTGATPARQSCLEVFSINMRSPFTILRKKEIVRLIIDDNDEDNEIIHSENLAVNLPQIDALKQESTPLPEPLATEPKMETRMVSVMKVEPKTTYCDVSTNTPTTDFSKTKVEPQSGCVIM
ncbi:hypothetical protein KR074_004677 [Drosophila pseudoananassae]|nr:hypothetical protein KR074_004677 [Drosophila pseudoananassae]